MVFEQQPKGYPGESFYQRHNQLTRAAVQTSHFAQKYGDGESASFSEGIVSVPQSTSEVQAK